MVCQCLPSLLVLWRTSLSSRHGRIDGGVRHRTKCCSQARTASKICLAKLACPMLDLSVFASHIRGVDGRVRQDNKQAWLDISESESYRCDFGNLNHKTFLDEFGRWTELAVAVICMCKITHAVYIYIPIHTCMVFIYSRRLDALMRWMDGPMEWNGTEMNNIYIYI